MRKICATNLDFFLICGIILLYYLTGDKYFMMYIKRERYLSKIRPFYYSIEEQKNTEPEEEKKEEDFSFQLDKDLVADVMDAEDEHGNRRNS